MDSEEAVTGRAFSSDYMLWAKTRSKARYNLATSGVPGVLLRDLRISAAELEINGPGGYSYTPLQEAISAEYRVPTQNIVAAGGTSGANAYALLMLLGPGDEALVEHPSYEVIPNLARFTGAKVVWFHRRPENGWVVDPEEVARLITPRTKLILLTNLHNPSSALISESALTEIGEIAARHNVYVVVDEVYLDCVWGERPRSAFHLGPNFIVTSSLTKIYGLSGLRCGWIFAPTAIAERLWRFIDLLDNIPAHPAELLSVVAFQQLAQLRERSKVLIEGNRLVYAAFAQARGFEVPRYGTVAFPRIMQGCSTDLCELLRSRYETTVVPGKFFGMPSHVRLSLVTPEGVLAEGLARFGAALDDTTKEA